MSVLNYVHCAPSCLSSLTCLRASRTRVPYVPACFCAFASSCLSFLRAYVPSFFYMLTCPHFLRALRAFLSLRALRALIFLCATRAFIILRTYILFMCMLIKLTQINRHPSTLIKYFHFYKTRVIFCMVLSYFKTKNINYF